MYRAVWLLEWNNVQSSKNSFGRSSSYFLKWPNVMKLELHLSVSVPETNFGDRVILTGNCESLGMWMADKSPSLSTSADTFPVWSIDTCVEFNPNLVPLEFKFAIVRNQTGFVVSLFICFLPFFFSR
jgi:hypothetical protein